MYMKTLQKYIKESIQGYHLKKKSCSCGCNTCDDKPALLAPILNESLAPRAILSEGLKYHIDNNKPLTEHVYRAGSKNYFDLWSEARALYSRGIIDIKNQDDLEILTETQLGEFGLYEGKKVPLDFIMEEIELEEADKKNTHEITLTFENSKLLDRFKAIPTFSKMLAPNQMKSLNVGNNNLTVNNVSLNGLERMESMGLYKISKKLEEADKKKKTPPIGKPKRGGSKKFYVYVRKPGGGIKKVSFGDTTGLSAKINNPEARRAFAKRHRCGTGEPKTSARYWSCRLPRFSKLLGLKSNFSGFW